MHSFDISGIRCSRCGQGQTPSGFRPLCPACSHDRFEVEFARSSSGVDLSNPVDTVAWVAGMGDLGLVSALLDEGEVGSSPFYGTQSILDLKAQPGERILEFLRSSTEDRHRLYVAWKRQEMEEQLSSNQRICRDCGLVFTPYRNPWNDAGLCSRICHEVHIKKRERLGKGGPSSGTH